MQGAGLWRGLTLAPFLPSTQIPSCWMLVTSLMVNRELYDLAAISPPVRRAIALEIARDARRGALDEGGVFREECTASWCSSAGRPQTWTGPTDGGAMVTRHPVDGPNPSTGGGA